MLDPIVQEVRTVREEHTRKFNGDLSAICNDLRKIQQTSGHRIVSSIVKDDNDIDRRIAER